MQVLCVASQEAEAAIACPVCGQQYEVFYSRNAPSECEAALAAVKKTLLDHHGKDRSRSAHPTDAFNVPRWEGEPFFSGAALLGGARPRRRPSAAEVVQVSARSAV